MKKDFKFYGFCDLKYLKSPCNFFPMNVIVVKSYLSLTELNSLFPFTNDRVKCANGNDLSNIPLNVPIQLTFGDPRLTPENVVATSVVYRKDSLGDVNPYLRVKISDFAYLYFYIRHYNPETRFGYIHARLTVPADLRK